MTLTYAPAVTNFSAAAALSSEPAPKTTWSRIEIEQHEGYWTVQDPETGIFGSGPDDTAALVDFGRALREHFDVLSRQEGLSVELAHQLDYLRQLLS